MMSSAGGVSVSEAQHVCLFVLSKYNILKTARYSALCECIMKWLNESGLVFGKMYVLS